MCCKSLRETSRAFAAAVCGLATTGFREVRDSDVGSAKLFQTRSRISQVLRTRPEAEQAAKFFVVAGHPLTHAQELESCTSEILLNTLRDVSYMPKEACDHELKVRIATSDRLAANMEAERESCAASEGQVGCISMRVVTSTEYQQCSRGPWTM